jgi:hypothetical protein
MAAIRVPLVNHMNLLGQPKAVLTPITQISVEFADSLSDQERRRLVRQLPERQAQLSSFPLSPTVNVRTASPAGPL